MCIYIYIYIYIHTHFCSVDMQIQMLVARTPKNGHIEPLQSRDRTTGIRFRVLRFEFRLRGLGLGVYGRLSEDLFSRIDANHDGVVSREEFAKAFQARVATGLGS